MEFAPKIITDWVSCRIELHSGDQTFRATVSSRGSGLAQLGHTKVVTAAFISSYC